MRELQQYIDRVGKPYTAEFAKAIATKTETSEGNK